MQIDLERWLRLRALAADAEHDGPPFVQVQEANRRWARARDELATLKATGATGSVSRPTGRARAGEEIRPGVGGHDRDGIVRAFERSVAELAARAAEAEQEAKRLADRLRQCSERRNRLQRQVEKVRRWADERRVLLPGDIIIEMPPMVTVQGPPPGTRDFFGRVT